MLKLLHIVGSRPQFPKVAAVKRGLAAAAADGGGPAEERLLHTGQHYDSNMSDVFFAELELEEPDFDLDVGSGSLAYQTAATLERTSAVLDEWRPDRAVVYGDTNATLAGALAAVQHHIPVSHVEAGVRTGNLHQAEELNRVVADRVCDQRFCCTMLNLENLGREGLGEGSFFTGDTMLDNYRHHLPRADHAMIGQLGLPDGGYVLCTVHRAENTDHPERLSAILDTLLGIQRELMPVVFPMHPRTRKAIAELGRRGDLERGGIAVLEPQGYLVTQALLEHAHCALSDSGGLLREAYFAGRFCVVPWEYGVWPELVEAGWASTGPVAPGPLMQRVAEAPAPRAPEDAGLFGDGRAGLKIAQLLLGRA